LSPKTALAKAISYFDPVSDRTLAECEEHYTTVHSPWARRMLRDTDKVRSYHTARATSRYDLRGLFNQYPCRWRYVILRLELGTSLGFDSETEELIAHDHLNFLQNYRGFALEEDLLLDRRDGQSTFEPYLFELDLSADVSPEVGTSAVDTFAIDLVAAAQSAYGLRTITLDRVLNEAAVGPMEHPGQRPLRRPLESTTKLAFIEFLFDQHEWAQEWFARPDVLALLRNPAFDGVTGHRVELRCGLDNR
jgi:hypothetical protein